MSISKLFCRLWLSKSFINKTMAYLPLSESSNKIKGKEKKNENAKK
jgi:hypothetical protein